MVGGGLDSDLKHVAGREMGHLNFYEEREMREGERDNRFGVIRFLKSFLFPLLSSSFIRN